MENYNEIKNLLQYREIFNHGSCNATETQNYYNIFSYRTLIFEWNYKENKIYFNYKNYSKTTGRLQNLILDNIEIENQTLKEYLQAYFKLNKLDREEYTINL
jgi:hypothetical protein